MRCRGAGRVHKGPHLLQAPWGLPGASLGLRTQREGRDVRAVFIGKLHNYCLPMRRGHSWWWVVGDGGGGGGQTICYVGACCAMQNSKELEQIGNIYSKRIFLAHIITNSSANG